VEEHAFKNHKERAALGATQPYATLGETQFSDLSPEEFEQCYLVLLFAIPQRIEAPDLDCQRADEQAPAYTSMR